MFNMSIFSNPIYSPHGYQRLSAALLITAAMLMGSGCNQPVDQQELFKATDVAGANFAKNFQLTDHSGQPRTLSDFKGRVVVLFFGYIHCPDICPNTLSELATVMERLGADAAKVQVLFVTLDPERDTPAILAQFVPSFNPTFIGLYGTPEQTAETAKEYKLVVQKQPGKSKGSYTLDHSAGTYIYDTKGELRLYASYGQGVEALVADIQTLLQTAGQ